jgi:hypothetical protein
MIVQTDADGTIYYGNLLVSLGWKYLFYLFSKRKYLDFLSRIIELPFFYFVSFIPKYVHTAFIPFRNCPIELTNQVNNRLKTKWLKLIQKYDPEKIIVVTHQDKSLLLGFLKNKGLTKRYNFEIMSNEGVIKNKKYNGKAKIKINTSTKYDYIKKDNIFIGDYRDYIHYGINHKNFVLIK